MAKYRIETTGDGAGTRDIDGTWDDVVNAVAEELKFEPTDADRAETRELLEEGLDGGMGWTGEYVYLQFEDGSLSVELVAEEAPDADDEGVCTSCWERVPKGALDGAHKCPKCRRK